MVMKFTKLKSKVILTRQFRNHFNINPHKVLAPMQFKTVMERFQRILSRRRSWWKRTQTSG